MFVICVRVCFCVCCTVLWNKVYIYHSHIEVPDNIAIEKACILTKLTNYWIISATHSIIEGCVSDIYFLYQCLSLQSAHVSFLIYIAILLMFSNGILHVISGTVHVQSNFCNQCTRHWFTHIMRYPYTAWSWHQYRQPRKF